MRGASGLAQAQLGQPLLGGKLAGDLVEPVAVEDREVDAVGLVFAGELVEHSAVGGQLRAGADILVVAAAEFEAEVEQPVGVVLGIGERIACRQRVEMAVQLVVAGRPPVGGDAVIVLGAGARPSSSIQPVLSSSSVVSTGRRSGRGCPARSVEHLKLAWGLGSRPDGDGVGLQAPEHRSVGDAGGRGRLPVWRLLASAACQQRDQECGEQESGLHGSVTKRLDNTNGLVE